MLSFNLSTFGDFLAKLSEVDALALAGKVAGYGYDPDALAIWIVLE